MKGVRPVLLASLAALLPGGALPGAPAQETAWVDPFAKDEVDRALEKAVAYLLRQQREDGSINDRGAGRRNTQHVDSNSTAMTSLGILAIASLGHQPGDPGPEGRALQRAVDCVLEEKRQDRNGYFGKPDSSRMYGHGITTLMLAELLGMGVDDDQDRRIRARLDPALDLILRSQKHPRDSRSRGGWRYNPESRDADLSVTVWQVMALRSARNAGLEVPKAAVEEAADYIRRSYGRSPRDRQGESLEPAAYAYQPGGRAEYSTASAGLLALQVCGFYDDPTVEGASEWLLRNRPDPGRNWFYYGTYYYAQGMYQRGERYAETARQNVREALLRVQKPDGSWQGRGQEQSAGRVYSTSLAVLSLSVKYHYLPIYQR